MKQSTVDNGAILILLSVMILVFVVEILVILVKIIYFSIDMLLEKIIIKPIMKLLGYEYVTKVCVEGKNKDNYKITWFILNNGKKRSFLIPDIGIASRSIKEEDREFRKKLDSTIKGKYKKISDRNFCSLDDTFVKITEYRFNKHAYIEYLLKC